MEDDKDTKVKDEYVGVEFAIEEGVERLTLALQWVLLLTKEEG